MTTTPVLTEPEWVDRLPAWGRDFYDYVSFLWEEGVFGLSYGEMLSAIAIILISLMIRGLFARTVVRAISKAASGTRTNLDDALVKTISEPLKIVPVIVGVYIAVQIVDLPDDLQTFADRIVRSMVAISVFWTLNRAVGAFSFLFTGLRETLSGAIVDWLVWAYVYRYRIVPGKINQIGHFLVNGIDVGFRHDTSADSRLIRTYRHVVFVIYISNRL